MNQRIPRKPKHIGGFYQERLPDGTWSKRIPVKPEPIKLRKLETKNTTLTLDAQQNLVLERLKKRVMQKVLQDDETGCWMWQGSISKAGYGTYTFNGHAYRAHRLSYMLHIGNIPDGLHIDHKCNTRSCVNPEHLEAVEPAENTKRAFERINDRGYIKY